MARMIGKMGVRSDIRVVTPQQLVPELAEELAAPDVTAVLFIDAALSESVATEVPSSQGGPGLRILEMNPRASCFGHHFSPSTLLAYSKLLYGALPPAWLLSIPGHDFGYGEALSEETGLLLPSALEKAAELLRRLP